MDIAVYYSQMELYKLQSVTSEVLNGARKRVNQSSVDLVKDGEPMPTVDKTTHVGITRSRDTDETIVSENIRRPGEPFIV